MRDTCKALDVEFDPWQDGLGRAILAKRADGLYAADLAVISIPRQVGKTYLIGWISFALCLTQPGTLVIWTAHRLRTAAETFATLATMSRSKRMRPHIRKVLASAENKEIIFENGSRFLVGARERGFGRGMTGVDVLVFDEGQILTESAIEDMTPATNVAPNPLIVMIGTPPRPNDPGEVFTRRRAEAISGESDDILYVELSADPDGDPNDREQWAKANPSFPTRTPLRAMQRMRKNLGPEAFWREALGRWDDDNAGAALDIAKWSALVDGKAERQLGFVFGVDIAEDRSAWIAVAWLRPDGNAQVQLVQNEPMPAFDLARRAGDLAQRWGGRFVIPKPLEEDFRREHANTIPMQVANFAQACGSFADEINGGTLRHGNQPSLNAAVRAARWRSSGTSGERAFQLKDAPEVGPLAAAVRALYGLRTHAVRSRYEDEEATAVQL